MVVMVVVTVVVVGCVGSRGLSWCEVRWPSPSGDVGRSLSNGQHLELVQLRCRYIGTQIG